MNPLKPSALLLVAVATAALFFVAVPEPEGTASAAVPSPTVIDALAAPASTAGFVQPPLPELTVEASTTTLPKVGMTEGTTQPKKSKKKQADAVESAPADAPPSPTTTVPQTTTTTAPPTTTTTAASGSFSSAYENQFGGLINGARSDAGLKALKRSGSLDSEARAWAKKMAKDGNLSHSNISRLLGKWSSVGENVAYGGSVSSIFSNLYGSAGHRDNMLGKFTHVGIGVWVEPDGQIWTCHVFAK